MTVETNQTISLLLPTRGRKEKCLRFLDSLANTAARPEKIEIVLCVDEDDTESHNISHDHLHTKMIIGPRQTMGQYNTNCLKKSSGAIIFLVNDDIEVKTDGWDKDVVNMHCQYSDEIYLGYPNDMFKKEKQPTFPIISKQLSDLLIDPFPDSYKGSFIEYHLLDIFMRLKKRGFNRIHFLENTIFEHQHYRLGKGTFDETYKNRDRFGDDMVFISENENRKFQAAKIIQYLETKKCKLKTDSLPGRKISKRLFFKYMMETAFVEKGIPIKWKFFLLWWFTARFVAKLISSQLINHIIYRKKNHSQQ